MRVEVASRFGRCHLRQQHALLPASVLCREAQLARVGLAHRNARLRPGEPCLPPVCLAFLEGGELHFPCRVLQLQVAGRNGLFADRDEQIFPLHRRFLEVPELRYNRVTVTVGDKWRAPGGGIIESVDTAKKTCRLKLEDGEIGAVRKGDICMGIYHSPVATENAAADADDSRMNRQYAGFATVYFTITAVSGERSEEFTYQLRPASERWPHEAEPYAFMHFACYGSFTDPERQTSVYETRTYTRMLVGQNTWECGPGNIGLQLGDLSGLSVHGMDMEGYSAYLSNVYFTGTIKQVRPDGTPVLSAADRGQWDAAKAPYAYYDRVSHGGRIYLCIAEDGTSQEPGPDSGDWLLQVDRGEDGADGQQGPQGEKGDKGDKGDKGEPGKDGLNGAGCDPVPFGGEGSLRQGAAIGHKGSKIGFPIYGCAVLPAFGRDVGKTAL